MTSAGFIPGEATDFRRGRSSIGLGLFLVCAGVGFGAERTFDFGGIELRFPDPEGMTEIVATAGTPPMPADTGKSHRSIRRLAYFHNDTLPAYAILSKDDGMDHRYITPEMLTQRANEIAGSAGPAKDPDRLEPGKGQYLPVLIHNENLVTVPSFIRTVAAVGPNGQPHQLVVWIHAYARIKNRLVLLSFFAPRAGDSTQAELLRLTEKYVTAVRKLNDGR